MDGRVQCQVPYGDMALGGNNGCIRVYVPGQRERKSVCECVSVCVCVCVAGRWGELEESERTVL